MIDKQYWVNHKDSYMIVGDLDKPFHRPECACQDCEQWRTENNRPTHEELRSEDARVRP